MSAMTDGKSGATAARMMGELMPGNIMKPVFDTHCHLQEARLRDDLPSLLGAARALGIERWLLAGVAPDGWEIDDELARQHEGLSISYGIHPQLIAERDDRECDAMLAALERKLRTRSSQVVCVGEIGLDGMGERRATLARQERLFHAQLELAEQQGLPVALHVLRMHPEALALLKQHRLPNGGVLHSCSAPPDLTAQYLALGLHISFSGALTWHGGDNRARRAAAVVPRDRLVVETDAPDQTPEPHRPGRNEPAFLIAIVAAVAHLWGVSPAEAGRVTDENARKLFAVG
jgi:TatD DNase family protein